MLMKGDINKLIETQINPVFETAFNRIEALSARVLELEEKVEELEPTKPVGRPRKNSAKGVDNNSE